MSDPENEHDENAPAADNAPEPAAPEPVAPVPAAPVRPRIWPALLIVLAYFFTVIVSLYLPTIFGNVAGTIFAPVLSTLLLAIWWLGFSRVPWKDRFAGVAVFAAVAAFIAVAQPARDPRILFVALPVMNVSAVLVLAATVWSAWPARRTKALLVLAACAVLFPMFRIDDVGSNLAPILKWRWSATSEDLLAETVSSENPGGTAELPATLGPLDWPAFRGPDRDGIVKGVSIATDWNSTPPKELWRRRVGVGFSSFAAVGHYIFTQEQRKDDEVVVCYNADTGDEVWINALKVRFSESVGDGPRATPTYESGKLYVQGATGVLQCLDATTGATLWKADVSNDTGANLPQWGFASSPLVTDKLVVVFTGGSDDKAVIAYDKASGTKAWCGGAGKNGYSSAQLADIGGVPQILMTSSFGVQSFEPATGAVLWENEWQTKMNPRVVQPTIIENKAVLVGTAEGKGTRYLSVVQTDSGWTVEEKWTTREFRPYFNDYVMYRGYCYGFDGNMLSCIDAHTGKRRWKGSHYGGQVLLVENSEVLIVLTEKGELALVKASPSAFEEIARIPAIKGKTWNHPVIANGRLFVRNAEEAACYALPAKDQETHS